MNDNPEVIYVGDPMCSWCWGISPVIHHIAERDDVDFRVLVGGLRPGPSAQPLDDSLRATLAHHWEQVAEASGQPFDSRNLARENWIYNTELPAIAVTTMRDRDPTETLRFFTDLQQAFYSEGVDITDPGAYPQLLAGYDVDTSEFLTEMTSPGGRTRAWQDFAESRRLGVRGFPTVLLEIDGGTQVLSRGYATRTHLEDQLGYWVGGRLPAAADVGTCSLDTGVC